MIVARLPIETENRLSRLAKDTHRPKSFYVREAITKYLEDIEDYYRAAKALEEFRESGKKAKPWKEVKSGLHR